MIANYLAATYRQIQYTYTIGKYEIQMNNERDVSRVKPWN